MKRQRSMRDEGGFTLVEVLVAAALFVVVSAGVAQLAAIATRAARNARDHTAAVILASSKIDELRALAWASGPEGLPASPAGTLAGDLPPYVEYLDAQGRLLAGAAAPPAAAVYVRRWSVALQPPDARTIVLHVFVTTTARDRSRLRPWSGSDRVDAMIVSAQARPVR
jgi:prepilin-type N-terminal cleavage/methylation domain-containing protein